MFWHANSSTTFGLICLKSNDFSVLEQLAILCGFCGYATNQGFLIKMKRNLSLVVLLTALWLLLSGHLEPLILGLGVASIAITFYLAHRMNVVDHESHPIHISRRLLVFWSFLTKEIILSNLDVVRRIIRPKSCISPTLFDVQLPQNSDLGRVIYANAITLTPGTVTIRVLPDKLVVHALCQETADDLRSNRMAVRVPDQMEQDS